VETLFPEAMYHELPKAKVRAAMSGMLDDLRPEVVAISGYGMADSRAALAWACRSGARKVMMTESKADDAPRVWWKEWLKSRLVRRFDSALCGGTSHRAYLKQLGMPPELILIVSLIRLRSVSDWGCCEGPARVFRPPGPEGSEQRTRKQAPGMCCKPKVDASAPRQAFQSGI
jgi:hypothetical protein